MLEIKVCTITAWRKAGFIFPLLLLYWLTQWQAVSLYFFSWWKVLLCSSVCLRTHYIDQSASVSWVPGLKVPPCPADKQFPHSHWTVSSKLRKTNCYFLDPIEDKGQRWKGREGLMQSCWSQGSGSVCHVPLRSWAITDWMFAFGIFQVWHTRIHILTETQVGVGRAELAHSSHCSWLLQQHQVKQTSVRGWCRLFSPN